MTRARPVIYRLTAVHGLIKVQGPSVVDEEEARRMVRELTAAQNVSAQNRPTELCYTANLDE
jgi:hypothetical protein